jgi:poly(3-hydroxybutyrate) depolymerase
MTPTANAKTLVRLSGLIPVTPDSIRGPDLGSCFRSNDEPDGRPSGSLSSCDKANVIFGNGDKRRLDVVVLLMTSCLLCFSAIICDAQESSPRLNNPGSGDQTVFLTIDGLTRTYIVHVPTCHDPSTLMPVVIVFHGGGGTAKAAMWETGWTDKADKEGFLAVFPEGTRLDLSKPARFVGSPQTWNDGSRRDIGAVVRNAADVEFVRRMIEDLETRFRIDKSRIYATGFSNGASMAFRVGRELPGTIAAIAPVAGSDWLEQEKIDRPVSLLYITGPLIR